MRPHFPPSGNLMKILFFFFYLDTLSISEQLTASSLNAGEETLPGKLLRFSINLLAFYQECCSLLLAKLLSILF